MNVLEVLLNRRWILKASDKELYYQVRDGLEPVKRFLNEKLGYQVIVNPYLIKVEKMPAQAKPWMGISEFNHQLQYVFLCLILMFLEDKEAEEQFVLSELTEYIQGRYKEESIDWTSYSYRRHLIRVIKFCLSCGMIQATDGSEEEFARNESSEVLYENTSVSRYFMKNFTQDIMPYETPADFAAGEWLDVDADRGIVRRQRVYRKLLTSIGMYREGENDEDFNYLRNYRNMIGGELAELLDCELQVHRSSAFLIMGEGGNLGRCFPEEKTLSDIVLLIHQLIGQRIEDGRLSVDGNDAIWLSAQGFREVVEECQAQFGAGFVKTYREMTTGNFYEEVRTYMQQLDLIELWGDRVLVRSVVSKVVGAYPADFAARAALEEGDDDAK